MSAADMPRPAVVFTPAKTALFAGQCGLIAMGSYFAQPYELTIATDLGFNPRLAGFMVTSSQLGYVAGLLLIAPLGDLLENRRLVLTLMAGSLVALLGAGLSPSAPVFMMACFGIGLFSVAVQMLVAFAGSMAADEDRGSVVGWVTGGLLIGLVAAWPVANLVGARLGWRGLYIAQASAVGVSILLMAKVVPTRRAPVNARYRTVVGSLWALVAAFPEVRVRVLMQACLFGAFSLFWTAVPLKLKALHFGRPQMAVFGLIGGLGLLVAPIAGQAADLGYGRLTGWIGIVLTATAFVASALFNSPWILDACAVLIGAGVQGNLVVSQQVILSMDRRAGHRLNGLFVGCFFVGGAAGSAVAGPIITFGWIWIAAVGAGCAAGAAILATRIPLSSTRRSRCRASS